MFGKGKLAGTDKIEESRGAMLQDLPVEKMTERDWRIFRENNDISVRGQRIPNPIRKWEEIAEEHMSTAIM